MNSEEALPERHKDYRRKDRSDDAKILVDPNATTKTEHSRKRKEDLDQLWQDIGGEG